MIRQWYGIESTKNKKQKINHSIIILISRLLIKSGLLYTTHRTKKRDENHIDVQHYMIIIMCANRVTKPVDWIYSKIQLVQTRDLRAKFEQICIENQSDFTAYGSSSNESFKNKYHTTTKTNKKTVKDTHVQSFGMVLK